MPVSASRKRLQRKGVEAFFSRSYEQRGAKFFVGLSAIVVGCTLWFILILDAYFKPFSAPIFNSYTSLLGSSLGLILVISGAGACLSPSTDHDLIEEFGEREELLSNRPLPDGTPTSSALPQGKSQFSFMQDLGIKYRIIMFLESLTAIALFSGLADEYQSNISMRQWVQSVFPMGRYFFNWEAVLVLATILGFTIVMFLPRRG